MRQEAREEVMTVMPVMPVMPVVPVVQSEGLREHGRRGSRENCRNSN